MAKKIQKSNMTQTDAKGKTLREPRNDGAAMADNFMWWTEKDDSKLANSVASTIKFIQRHQSSRNEQLTVSTRLYGNSSAFNLIGTAFTRANSVNSNPSSQRMSYNLCQSVIDTLVSKVAKNKVVPTFITNGGVWGMQQKAQQLSKFTEGCFYANDVHSKGMNAFRDACVWGTGILHIFNDDGKIGVERVLPQELFVDLIETLVTKPQSMHRVKTADRGCIMALFGDTDENKQAIKEALPAAAEDIGSTGTAADLVTLTESWHLASGPDAEDGMHAICLGDHVLRRDVYTKDFFPFAFISWNERLLGFWGQGLCEQLQNLQGEINRLMILIQRSMWMGGSFKVLVENGSKVVSQHINNDVGAIIHYTGTPPQYITPPMIQQDIYPYVDALIAKGYQQAGISQLSASSQKPAGLNSGAALRAYGDLEADRFLFVGQQVEKFFLEIGRQMIEVAKDIYKTSKTFKVVFPSTSFIETIDWKDIKLKDDEYVLKAFPTSSLPDEPAGRLQTIQELAQAGMVSPRQARRLMDMPDLEMSDNLANAAEDLLHKIFEKMLEDDGKYRAPEPFMDLNLGKELVLEYMNYADAHNCPEDRMNLLRRFLSQTNDLLGLTQPPAPPQQIGAPGAPQAVPTPAPVSPLLANVPGGR
jgi:hypothetical protein